MTFYAHSRPDSNRERWQELRRHLDQVATLAELFAPSEWKTHARVAGLWHDAGKYQLAFQRYIEKDVEASNEGAEGRRIQHAIVGAAHALRKGMDLLPIALAVQAHHGSLKNVGLLEDAGTNIGNTLLHAAERDGLPQDLMEVAVPQLPPEAKDRLYLALAMAFFSRLWLMRTPSIRRSGIRAKLGRPTSIASQRSQYVCRARAKKNRAVVCAELIRR